MKTNRKKIVVLALIVGCMLFCLMAIFLLQKNQSSIFVVKAQEPSESQAADADDLSPQEVIAIIQEDMQAQGTSISAVLQSRRDFYMSELNTASDEEKNIIFSKINVLDEALLEFGTGGESGGIEGNISGGHFSNMCGIAPDCTCDEFNFLTGNPCPHCQIYSSVKKSVFSIMALFYLRHWYLASDLLNYNLANTTLDIDYWPELGETIAQAPQIANELAYNNGIAAAFDQDSPGRLNGLFESTIEGDAYNSLGNFYYSKTDAGDGNVNISIMDRYDWKYETEGGIGAALNNIVFQAQELGIVTPFCTRISFTIPGTVPFYWHYTDTGVEILGLAKDTAVVGYSEEIYDLRIRPTKDTNPSQIYITSIAPNAFSGNAGITEMTLPDTVINIGAGAFAECTSLTNIILTEKVASIGTEAFAGCSSLPNITIPAGLTTIGTGAFAGCSNLNISVDPSNPNYSAQGNILYNKAKTKIIGSGDIAENITIPNTVTEVEDSAFRDNSNLKRVDIYGTPKIGEFSFSDCENLDEVYFYSYVVPEVEAGAFANNAFTVYVPYNKQSIYYTRFSGYTNSIDSIPITVTLKKDGAVYQTLNTYYGADISGLSEPYKEGHTFNYWEDEAGTIYQNGGIWNSTVDLSVEAIWTARQFYITFTVKEAKIWNLSLLHTARQSERCRNSQERGILLMVGRTKMVYIIRLIQFGREQAICC